MNMIHDFIGPKAFKEAIQEYMDSYAYDNATTEDLWHHLSGSSDQDIEGIMTSWIRELGFPVVKAKMIERDNQQIMQLIQERFSNAVQGNRNVLWNIPMKAIYMDKDGELHRKSFLFDRQAMEVELPNFDLEEPKCWIKDFRLGKKWCYSGTIIL